MGIATTRPFKLFGRTLTLNVAASEGDISVEVLDQKGVPINGFSEKNCRALENVDSLRAPVNWTGLRGLAGLEGQTIRLRFRLRNAALFAFQVQP